MRAWVNTVCMSGYIRICAGRALHSTLPPTQQHENAALLVLLCSFPSFPTGCDWLPADGMPVATEELRYGLRVAVVVLPCHPHLRSEKALTVVGPLAFGYRTIDYTPIGPYPTISPVPLCKSDADTHWASDYT